MEKVNHPSLPDHPDHALYERYFPNGGASIFTFEIKGGQKEAWAFIDHLEIFSLLANVADVKSLVIHPASTTHSQLSEEELLDQGIRPNTIRLSIGTEHIDDIIEDLENGFVYIELSRNTPLLVQLFFIYYGLPKIGIRTDPETCGVAGLAFLGGSYMAEAFRAAWRPSAESSMRAR